MYPYWHSQSQTIGGQRFEKVMEVKLTADGSEGGWPLHCYWAPGKGIVRQRVQGNNVRRTRMLVRSNIIQ